MEINLIEIWQHMGLPVRCVVVLLTIQAIACFAVIVDRLIMLRSSRARSEKFAIDAAGHADQMDPSALLKLADASKGSHLAGFLAKGLKSFVELTNKGHAIDRAAELTRRALERKAEPMSRDLNRGMNVLASTGSTAPFVGLLGTVLGILQAFKQLATTGSGGIGAIGGAIAEALIVTGYGLTVAIPVVLLFNWLSAKLAGYEGDILNAAGDLLDRLEIGGGATATAPAAPSHEKKHKVEGRAQLATSPSA